MQKRNNLLTLCTLLAVLFLCGIPMVWCTIVVPRLPAQDLTGINDTIHLLWDAPVWFLIVISTSAMIISALNVSGVTSISPFVPTVALLFSGVHYVAKLFTATEYYQTGSGPLFAIVNTVLALWLTFASSSPRLTR